MLSPVPRLASIILAGAIAASVPGAAHAEGFLSDLFRALSGAPPRAVTPPSLMQAPNGRAATAAPMTSDGNAGAFCVRSCDGRYFPLSSGGGQGRASLCSKFCPASPTVVVYGRSIDRARASDGRAYQSLPNAYRFREEIVAGCTCNGVDSLGLAAIDINADPTLRKGDIVAGRDGLVVAGQRAATTGGASIPDFGRESFARVGGGAAE